MGSVFSWTLCTWDVDTFVPIMLDAWNQFYRHLMNSTTLQLHEWLEITWHYFQLSNVVFRFELAASELDSSVYVNI